MEQTMKNLESQAKRKEKLLQRLRSLSPTARKAILQAALVEKQNRKADSQRLNSPDCAAFGAGPVE